MLAILHVRLGGGGVGPRPQKVFIHNYPFEASSDSLSLVLKRFGDVKDISHLRWLHMKDIFDGVRVVTMLSSLCDKHRE